MSVLVLGALSVATALRCSPSGAPLDDGAWWAELSQPPLAARAWPLDRLAAPVSGEEAATGVWRLDDRAADGSWALCRDVGADRWRALSAPALTNFDVRLRARTAPSGSEAYGLAFRRSDAGDYYLARVDTRNNTLRLYRQQAGRATLLAARDLGVTVGQWHELAVHAAGPRLALALDGEPVLQVVDDSLRAGGLALWADAQTRVCFAGLWLDPRDSKDGGAFSER